MQPNSARTARTETLKIGGQSYTINQSGDAKPMLGPVNASYSASVGVPFSLTIPTANAPAIYTATRRPRGLTLSDATGTVSGTPMLAGQYAVTVTATNAAGATDAPLGFAILVTPVPATALGTYHGLIERDRALNGDLGSSFVLTTTSTGAFTLKLTTGRTATSFKGALDFSGAAPALTVPVLALGATLSLQFDPVTGDASGTLSKGSADTAAAQGWRSAKDVERQEAVVAGVPVKEAALLVAVDALIRRVEIQDQLRRRLGEGSDELLQQHLVKGKRGLAVHALLEPAQGRAGGQGLAALHRAQVVMLL